MKKLIKLLLVVSILFQMIPMQVHASEKTFLEQITAQVDKKVKTYASSINQANADTNAALILAKHGISGGGTLKGNEKHALNAAMWNSKLGQAAYIEGISEAITKLQQLPLNQIQIGYCVNWGSTDKQYFYSVNAEDLKIFSRYNYKYEGSTNTYDKNLTWIAGSTNADLTIKEKSVKDKTITYEVSYVIYDDFNFENGKGSVPKQILFLISSKLFKEFHWEIEGKFEVEVINTCNHTSNNYHLVFDNNNLKSKTNNEFDLNLSKKMITQPIEKGSYFSLDKTINLFYDREWVLEYTIENSKRFFALSPTNNISSQYFQIMCAHDQSAYSYFFKYFLINENDKNDKSLHCFTYKSDGLVNKKNSNTIRLENEIGSNGKNKIHITIIDNDSQIVVVDSYIDTYYQVIKNKFQEGTTKDSVNKNDIRISYIGNNEYYFDVEEFELKVWENAGSYFKEKITKPTCVKEGSSQFTCKHCGYSYKKTTNALGHEFSDYMSNDNGTSTAKCKRCDVTDTRIEILYGDVNDDGKVNQLDRMTLSRYLAKWQGYEKINDKSADVNHDSKINQLDRMILSRYLAKWQGYEVLPYVK